MDLHTIGIDLGKTVFHLVGLRRGLPQGSRVRRLDGVSPAGTLPLAASRSCSVSANVVTPTCGDFSCKEHVRSCNNARSNLPV